MTSSHSRDVCSKVSPTAAPPLAVAARHQRRPAVPRDARPGARRSWRRSWPRARRRGRPSASSAPRTWMRPTRSTPTLRRSWRAADSRAWCRPGRMHSCASRNYASPPGSLPFFEPGVRAAPYASCECLTSSAAVLLECLTGSHSAAASVEGSASAQVRLSNS